MAKLSKRIVREAFPDSGGVVKMISDRVGCSTTAYYIFEEKNPDIKEERLGARAEAIDDAETTIFKAAREGNLKAAIHITKTLGKDRGWVERTETVMSGGLDLTSAREAYLKATREGEDSE